MHVTRRLLGIFFVAGLLGCGEAAYLDVSGKVTVDGQPVTEGVIQFVPADRQGPTAGARIEAGSYAAQVPPGRKIVQIEGYRKVGEKQYDPADPTSPVLPVTEPIVPERYRGSSELVLEVAESTDDAHFHLKTGSGP